MGLPGGGAPGIILEKLEKNMEKIVIAIVVGISLLYIIRRIWVTMSSSPEDACGCGCSGCGAASNCDKDAEGAQPPGGCEE